MSTSITVRMPDDLMESINELAEGRKLSAVVIDLVRSGLGNRTAPATLKKMPKTSEKIKAAVVGGSAQPEDDDEDWPVPVSVETAAEAAQVPRVLKEPKYVKATRDNLPGPPPVKWSKRPGDPEEFPAAETARAANICTHGNEPKFCLHCKIFAQKYGKAKNG